ncbi:MAG: transposase [Verrucomicrobia bacterium]|nr:transposase [Verrucomicrobiota bacterium]
MARRLRLEYPGAIYHVMSRGAPGGRLFRTDADRALFLKTLSEACRRTSWEIHAWCLMKNHVHLVIETPCANLSAGMKWLLGTYTSRHNRRHRVWGHLFAGRFKSLIVDGSGNGYLRTVCDYVHLNPARAKLLRSDQRLAAFVWSSFREYLKPPSERVQWLRVDRLFGEMRIAKDSPAGRKEFERITESRRGERWDGKPIERGWCYGEESFRQELMTAVQAGEYHSGEQRREIETVRAERLVGEELKRLRWTERDLATRRKGDPGKVRIAGRLRTETVMSLKWIAQRLKMGTWTHVANRLYWERKAKRSVIT